MYPAVEPYGMYVCTWYVRKNHAKQRSSPVSSIQILLGMLSLWRTLPIVSYLSTPTAGFNDATMPRPAISAKRPRASLVSEEERAPQQHQQHPPTPVFSQL